jgi:hypothetical protein
MGTQSVPPHGQCQTTIDGLCGVKTFTASQIGSLFALPLGAALFLWDAGLHKLDIQFLILYAGTFVYYTITGWRTEEDLFRDLQNLGTVRRKLEIWVRILQTTLLGVAAAGVPQLFIDRFLPKMTRIEASYLLLALILTSCLFWDFVVVSGGIQIPRRVVVKDFIGGFLVVLLIWCRRWNDDLPYVIVIVAALILNVQVVLGDRASRLSHRASLR